MGGGSSKNTADSVQPNNAVPPFKIVLRRCTGLAKTDSNGLTDCYIVGRFFDTRSNKFIKKLEFKSSVREKTLDPVFDEVHVVSNLPGLHIRVDLECWDEDKGSKDDFLGMHRIYLGQFDDHFQKYVPHRRDFATIPYERTVKLSGKVGEVKKNVQGELTFAVTRERVDDCHFIS